MDTAEIVFAILCIGLLGCQTSNDRNGSADSGIQDGAERVEEALSGRKLAEAHCQGCHAFPNPELLDRETWTQVVLPRMGRRMGIYEGGERPDSLFEEGVAGELVREADIFPKEPTLSREKWRKIVEYFAEEAPDTLSAPPDHPSIQKGLDAFEMRRPSFRTAPPTTTLIRVGDPSLSYLGDAKGLLTILDARQREEFTMDIPGAPVSMQPMGNRFSLTLMGDVAPTNTPTGRILELALRRRTKQYKYNTLIDSLHRPVHTVSRDLNGDRREDFLVSEFGYQVGRLAWYERQGATDFQRHVLRNKPGAIKSVVRDFNGNGRPDVMSLFAQGDESIFLFHNEGGGEFREEQILQFPPSYGSTDFELVDFNGDGVLDILHTAGDNADYRPVMKPYHGVRVFLNKGGHEYEQAYFFPLNGAYGVTADDFDGDGDLDIAATSFFPDYAKNPEESFVYLEHKGDLHFEPSTFENSDRGRWLVLDSGDADGDGDPDLLLGSFSALQLGTSYVPETTATQWTQEGPSTVMLENMAIAE